MRAAAWCSALILAVAAAWLFAACSGTGSAAPATPQKSDRVSAGTQETPGNGDLPLAIDPSLEQEERPWMLDDFGMHRGKDLQVTSSGVVDHSLRLTISEFEMYNGETVVLDLNSGDDGEQRAQATISWVSDCGPPVPWENLSGRVRISSRNWSGFRSPGAPPLVVQFWIHGRSSGYDDCVHGIVEVPK